MEAKTPNPGNVGPLAHGSWLPKALPDKFKAFVVDIANTAKRLAQDNPRRIAHSFKVGLALTLVSMFYYFKPLYDGFGVNAMWAVLTVVVVFEFSVGATFGKGINRMIATLLAAALGIGVHDLATLSGRIGEPLLIATFVFIIAAIVTFMRFFPELKARYDYGLSIFILTFCLVSVSGYRDSQVMKRAEERLSTIIIGSVTAMLVCVCICPVWIGQELHKQVAVSMEELGNFLERFGDEYFKASKDRQSNNNSFLDGYKSVLSSKNSQESMVNLAKWEPGHGGFKFCHPWKQYLKLGTLTQECANKIEALNNYLHPDIHTPLEIQRKIQESFITISTECGKALTELSSATKKMKRSRSADPHVANSKAAAENLKTILKTGLWKEETYLLEIIPVASVASLLLQVVECTENITEAVYELASMAGFKQVDTTVSPEQPNLNSARNVKPVDKQQHVVTIKE